MYIAFLARFGRGISLFLIDVPSLKCHVDLNFTSVLCLRQSISLR